MNWLTNLPPGLKSIFAKKDESEGDSLWVKCPKTGELVYRQELESAYWVTPSGAHMRGLVLLAGIGAGFVGALLGALILI